MARKESAPDYLRGIRRVVLGVVCLGLVALFLLWRIDNTRVEQFRADLVDQFVPSFGWTVKPVAATARMLADFRAYSRVYAQNAELRRELQRMQGWREAALQLEQKNARLLALNKVRLNPRATFVTAEVMADSGSPFRRSATINVGRLDGVTDGAAVLDGLGLVGRVAGVAERSSRILFVTDASSRVPVIIRPSGQRALLTGDNGPAPALDFVDGGDPLRPGDRIITSADGGLYPPDILVGQVFAGPDGRNRVRLSADFHVLDFVRVVRAMPEESVDGPGGLIGPLLPDAAAQAAAEAPR